jgi:hypothetical protein
MSLIDPLESTRERLPVGTRVTVKSRHETFEAIVQQVFYEKGYVMVLVYRGGPCPPERHHAVFVTEIPK